MADSAQRTWSRKFGRCLLCVLGAIGIGAFALRWSAKAQEIVLLDRDGVHAGEFLGDSVCGIPAVSPLVVVDPRLEPVPGADIALLREFDLVLLSRRDYGRGARRLRVELFEMAQASEAFGLSTLLSARSGDRAASGSDRYAASRTFPFHRLVVRITNAGWQRSLAAFGETSALIQQDLIGKLRVRLKREASEPPTVFKDLPVEGQVPGSARLVFGPAGLRREVDYPAADEIRFEAGAKVALARYRQKDREITLAIIEYQTPQLATEGLTRLRTAGDSIRETDHRPLLKRAGNYVVAVFAQGDSAAGWAVAGRVQYSYTVKYLASPHPPRFDYARYRREAYRMLVGILWLTVGVTAAALLFGTLYGVWLFARRRRKTRNVFTDAGGMLRLNLDKLLPPSSADLPPRLLKDGD